MRRLSILVAHLELPLHDQSSASFRLRQLLELMVNAGHHVTYFSRAGLGQDRYVTELDALGVEVIQFDPGFLQQPGHRSPGPPIDLPALLRRGRFDIAYLYFLESAELYVSPIRTYSPATRIIIDTVDVQYVREQRGADLSADPRAREAAQRTREREAAYYGQADALVAVSDDDARALSELCPDVPVTVIGNVHPAVEPGPGFGERAGLLFVGVFHHAPNVDAILHFHETAWPRIRAALPQASLTLVGGYAPQQIEALAGNGIDVAGWVPDLAPLLHAARVSIAPLRFGAGVKGKIGESLSYGLPVVTTPIGAEGMGLLDGDQALIAEAGAPFAEAVVRLYDDRSLWEHLAESGREHIAGQFSPEAVGDRLLSLLRKQAPTCFVAVGAWTEGTRLDATLSGYLQAFSAPEPVSLLLPITPRDPVPETAYQRVEAAIAAAGYDTDSIPDIALSPCAADPAFPSNAILVDDTSPEGGWHAPRTTGRAHAGSEAPTVSVIICVHGKQDFTERCLQSLDAQLGDRMGTEVEVIVVDNASPDATLEMLDAWRDRVRVIALPKNRNFAGGNNVGAAASRGELLLFLNNDTEVIGVAIDTLTKEASRPGIGAVGARLLYPDGRIQHGGFMWRPAGSGGVTPFHLFQWEDPDVDQAQAAFDVSAVTGACLTIPRLVFDAVGGFDEAYVNGWEDVDLCQRIRASGARIRQCGAAAITHHEGVTTGRRYANHRNLERFTARWANCLVPDQAVLHQFGARFNDIVDAAPPPPVPDGAPVRIVGPLLGLGSAGAEARGLWRALHDAGIDVAAHTPASSAVGPALSERELVELYQAHLRPPSHTAVTLVVPDASTSVADIAAERVVVRARSAARLAPGARGRVLTPPGHLAAAPAAAGARPEVLAPCGIPLLTGQGDDGTLCLLPSERPMLDAVLDALAATTDSRMRLAPLVRTRELSALVRASLPEAEVVDPIVDEAHLASLARECATVIIAVDDPFGRSGMTAAGTGAAVVVAADNPAAAVLGELADAYAAVSAESLRHCIVSAQRRLRTEREQRAACVHEATAEAATRLVQIVTSGAS